MPDKTNTLRIWSHVRQIAALSKNAGGDAWFSVNLAPVFAADPSAAFDVTADLARNYLRPWTWEWTSLRLALISNGVVQRVIDVPATQILREDPIPALTGNAAQRDSGAFNEEFNLTAAAMFQSSCFVEAKTDPTQAVTMSDDTLRDWKMYLLHASSYAGDIPLRAGLSAWFHVPYSQLTNIDEIVVAPVFANAPFSAASSPQDPPNTCLNLTTSVAPCPLVRLKSTLDPLAAGDTTWVTRWTYAAPASGDLQAEWIQPYTTLRTPGTSSWQWGSDGFIDESTLWVTAPAAGSSTWAQGADGHDQLEQRLSGLFDLPLRLLEWADQALLQDSPLAIDPNFGTALIATMRDLIRTAGDPSSHQVVERPDGVTVADDIARVIAPRDSTIRQQLIATVQAYYKQYDDYQTWIGRLTDVLKGSGRCGPHDLDPGWEKPPATGQDFKPWLKLMHKMRAWLFDPVNLKAFIRNDWETALTNASLSQLWKDHSSDVDAYLTDIDVVTVLRLGFLGSAWKKLTGDWYDPANVAQSVNAALIGVYERRLGLQAQGTAVWGYENLQPRADGVSLAQKADIETYLRSFIEKWRTSPNGPAPSSTDTTPADYSRGNQGINIQFSKFAATGDQSSQNEKDEERFLSTFRGVGVMLRPSGPSPLGTPWDWCVLHLGQYSVRGEVDPKIQKTPDFNADRVVVAPAQIIYRNGLRQVSCTYRNQPLAPRSPAAALSQVRSFQEADGSNQSYDTHRLGLFELWNPYFRGGASPFHLPRLVFGMQYDAAAFAVGLAGELPTEICDTQKPWRVSSTPTQWNPPASAQFTTKPYLRTVPIGLVRVEGENRRTAGNAISKMTGPSIPDGVYPIIRSINKIADQEDTVIFLCDTDGSSAWSPTATNSATFFMRPPATDLATFDSWPTSSTLPPADRAALYSFIAQNTDTPNDQRNLPAPPDLTLDDPAVTGFSVTLSQVYPTAVPGVAKKFDLRRPTPLPNGPPKLLQQFQSASVRVDITAKAGTAQVFVPQLASDPYAVKIAIPPGTVYRIDIAPVAVTNLIALALKPAVATRTFYVEVATPLGVPDLNAAATALNDALVPKLTFPGTTTQKDDRLEVALNLAALGNLAPQIHRVELMIQRWRWQGRPLARQDASGSTVYDFPYDQLGQAVSPDQVLTPLDGIYFGERDSNDQLVVSAQVDSLLPATQPLPLLYTYDLSHSPQALYYRFAVRVFSRYEGLLARGASVESRILGIVPPNATAPPEQWRRVLPLCRRTAPAPKPAIRLIIPLTQTVADEKTPGLLAVLDDAWFDWAGLAEQLQVRVTSVTTAPASDGTRLTLTQAGPDPVVTNPIFTRPLQIVPPDLEAIGPIGFTADTNTNAPLFAKTSFVIPAPTRATDGVNVVEDLSWWLLQLQFKRVLNPEGTVAPDGTLMKSSVSNALDSDWTLPIPVQLLPAANLWDVSWNAAGTAFQAKVDTGDLVVNFSRGIAILDSAGNALTVDPFPADTSGNVTNRFEVWVLLTVRIEDAFGHSGQEAFVDLVPFADLSRYEPPPGKSAPTTIRLVEVQCMNKYSPVRSTWTDLAGDLFPEPPVSDAVQSKGTPPENVDPAMARARIVRVSPPITGIDSLVGGTSVHRTKISQLFQPHELVQIGRQ
jgi:hypothetical protein